MCACNASASQKNQAVFEKVAECLYRLASTDGYYTRVWVAGKEIRHSLKAKAPFLAKRRIFELHEEHALHVHLLTNRRIDVNQCRPLAVRSGWGRIQVQRIPKEKAGYVGKYLSKERPKAFKGWRLWAGFGDEWERTKVGDIQTESLYASVYRGMKEAFHWRGNRDFRERARIATAIAQETVLQGWTPGLGPQGRLYSQCRKSELLGVKHGIS